MTCLYLLQKAFPGQGTELYPSDNAKLAVVVQKQFEVTVIGLCFKFLCRVYHCYKQKTSSIGAVTAQKITPYIYSAVYWVYNDRRPCSLLFWPVAALFSHFRE